MARHVDPAVAAAAGFGLHHRPTPKNFVASDWRPLDPPRNTLRGFVNLRLPSGMVLRDCSLHVQGEKRWIAFPAVPMIDRDGNTVRDARGKTRWAPVVDTKDKPTRDRLQEAILDVQRRSNPETFAGEGG